MRMMLLLSYYWIYSSCYLCLFTQFFYNVYQRGQYAALLKTICMIDYLKGVL